MSTKSGGHHRNLTLEERVNLAAGEDASDNDSEGLDMVKQGLSLDDYINSVDPDAEDMNVVEISSGDDRASEDSSSRKRKRLAFGAGKGERVAFDEDEDSDAAYNIFKKRKSEKRKKEIASTRRAKARAANGSVVGKRPGTLIPLDKKRRRKEDMMRESDDEDLMETTLPQYLQSRRKSWDERREKLGNAGLQIPPSYDEVEFSGDERLENLRERPHMGVGTKRQAAYKDIDLPYSAGIIPAPIAQWLRDYQVEGAAFLHELFVYQKGGILGDDMGLGKTIQVIAFLTAAFGKTGDERDKKRMRKMRRLGDDTWYPRVLIICPGSLMANWKRELDTWGWWNIYMYHGSVPAKEAALAAAQTGRLEIMLTTYTTYRLNKSAINGIRWDCVVADECHTIKEKSAEITMAMNEVNALCRIGLTGTAIQNKYEELWTLLNWTNPGRLSPLSTWKQVICLPLKIGQSHDATNTQLSKARRTAQKLVNNLLPTLFLRRMKSLIADQLPKKSDQVIFCPMTETTALAYNNFCDSEIVQGIFHASDPCTCGSGKKQGWCCHVEIDGIKWQNFVFPAMITLQKLANHLALLIPSSDVAAERHEKDMEIMRTALPDMWEDLYKERDSIMNYANTEFCGKWKILRKLLKFWHDNGDKVLVFSYSVRLLRMLHMLFKSTTTYNVSYLDGSLSYEERQQVVDDYNSDPQQFVFLISTKAGGVGLNITSANKVVVVDPNWNPACDLQAQDRAYRIGQTRDVQVFRLVSVGTVEEIVYARQIYKQQQANIGYNASLERRYFSGVQDLKEMKGEIFGLGNLFAPLSANLRLRDIVNKTNIAETRAGVEIADLEMDLELEAEGSPNTNGDGAAADESNLGAFFDDSRPDAAMSQLAASIIDEPARKRRIAAEGRKKQDAVQAILASAGVEYSHENAQVVGTSKMETRISDRAAKAGSMLDMEREVAFTAGGSGIPATKASRLAEDHAAVDDGDLEPSAGIRYRYRPPEDVRRRQFCTMARGFGYTDITEFALVVEGWTQAQRRECLERFYRERKVRMAETR